MIRFDHVTKSYPGGTTAVADLTLEAPTGHTTVLVGPSGCGKTTSLRMINRMIEATSGTISIDGHDVASMNPVELRRGIGYVIQAAGLFPHRTIVDNVSTVPLLLGWPKDKARRRSMELIERVGLDPGLANRYPHQLSGGQQQRVGVARALAADPPIMLLDEPFSAVDPVVRAELQDEFLRLKSEFGKTTVFVTHDIDEAITVGDQIAVLRGGGRLAQFAPPSALLSRPADDFVAGFVGRDRGYRALGLRHVQLSVCPEPTVRAAAGTFPAAGSGTPAELGGWIVAVDEADRPTGWVAAGDGPGRQHLGGTLATPGGSLRQALDAVLSSPSGRGVVVDEEGRFAGTVTVDTVLAAIDRDRAGEEDDTP